MHHHFNLTLLNTLVMVAETGSLTAAAPRLYKSQSAVSEQIRKLEEICGQSLLFRGKSGAHLTPTGERLVEHAKRILSLSDAAYRDIQGTQLEGQLRLAITDYFRPNALPDILKRVRDRFPHLRLHVSILKSARIEEEQEKGTFDIGLSMSILRNEQPITDQTRKRIRLRREPLRWIAGKPFIQLDTDTLPLVLLPDTCSLQHFIIQTLNRNGIRNEIAHTASGVGGLHLALAAGLGVSCLNASAIPEGIDIFSGTMALPPLPDVEFSLTPARQGEAKFVSDVREMLAEELG